jgi:hypothetical protein
LSTPEEEEEQEKKRDKVYSTQTNTVDEVNAEHDRATLL